MTRPRRTQRLTYLLVLLLVALWLAACAWLSVSVYRGVRAGTTRQMAQLQSTLAGQAARSISDHLEGMRRDLGILAGNAHVADASPEGFNEMRRFLEASGDELQSITRMSADGTILFTWPNTGLVGSNIGGQPHVRRLLSTHRPVLSDVFTSVQGYRSIALHVPVFRAGAFDGSIGVLVPIQWIARRFLEGIRVGRAGYAWVIGRDGVEIYSPNAAQVGTSAVERDGLQPEERALARAMARGDTGNAVLTRDHASGAPIGLDVVYMPIPMADSFWSIAVAAKENEILSMMRDFLQPWFSAILLALAGVAGALLLAVRLAVAAETRRAREQEQERYRAIVEKLPVINYVVDVGPPSRTSYISPQLVNILGFTPAQWTSDPGLWRQQIHPADRGRVEEEIRRNDAQREPTDAEYRMLTRDGRVRWIHNRSTWTSVGGAETITGVMLDVTDRRQAEDALREREEQLLQAHKLEAIGRLAGGVAHDFNNLLTVIAGYADLVLEASELPVSLRADVKEILASCRRAQSLTGQLLAYSRKQVLSPHVIDLNAQVAQAEALLHRLIGEDITLVTTLGPGTGKVRADPGQLQQVIMNLAVNARDAMAGGGTLTIATSGAPGDAWAELTVRDTGTGMDSTTLSHIFEPFFTTKEDGKGTGLGLSTVYGIVTQSGGTVSVESAPGTGSAFTILLPRVKDDGETDPSDARAGDRDAVGASVSTPQHAEGRILLVEDEAVVRDYTRAVLAKAGYTVIEAGNGREALTEHENLVAPVDLLVTDVVMPGMGGMELARRLRSLHPELKVIFISGYADDALGGLGELVEGNNLLRKPFSGAQLLSFITRVRSSSG
jgi:PAS domain S-box-containing protein